MDIGDIIRLIFFAFILFSLFGGLFGRGQREGSDQQTPGPRDISQSGGEPPRPRPQRQQQPQRPPQERQMPTTATEWWEELTGQRTAPQQQAPPRQETRPQPPPEPQQAPEIVTYDDAIERGEIERQQRRREREAPAGGQSIRATERERMAGEISDASSPIERASRRRRRDREIGGDAAQRARTGGDVVRRSLRQPETLERAFILKEVLDTPLAMRKDG